MTDRNVLNLLRVTLAPLVAFLLLGAFWLGVKALPRHKTPATTNLADAPLGNSPSELSPPFEVALPYARFAGDRGNGAPRNDPARGSQAGPSSDKRDGSAATNGPVLIFPNTNYPPGYAPAPDAATGPWPGVAPDAMAYSRSAPAVLPPGTLASPLPATQAPGKRSEQLELIAREADSHSRYAFELANRGAVYAARAELTAALRLVAQGLDGEERTTAHSRALTAGLTALKEVEDFVPNPSRLEGDLNLAAIVASHRTPVLRDAPIDGLTALNAMQQYLTFCQEQLAAACGREVAGSMTLYGLGKLHALLAGRQNEAVRAAAPKAMAFYQASLLVYPRNYMASNDLGVLLARAGRYQDARLALEHSVAIYRQEENWQNLAGVYRHLGQWPQAQYAEQQLAAIRLEKSGRAGGTSTATGPVQWVDPSVMAQAGPAAAPRAQQSAVPSPPASTGNASTQGQSRPMSARLPNALFEKR